MRLSDLDLLVNIDDTVYKLEEIKKDLLLNPSTETEPYVTTIPFKLRGFLQKASDTEHIIAGYASVIEIDKEEQLIPKETLQDGIETLLKNSDYANLMLVHQNVQVGKILESYGNLTTHVDDKGLFVVCSVREDLETANEIWEQILDGELNGFSIAAEVLMEHEECDTEKCILVIDKMNIFELSLCVFPVNSKSGFVVVSKSESKDLEYNVRDYLNREVNVNMAKKGKKQQKEVEKSEELPTEEKSEEVVEESIEVEEKTPEESVEEIETETIQNTIESLQREVEALKGIISEMKAMPDEEEEEEEDEEEEIIEEEEKPTEEPKEEPEEEKPTEEKSEEKPTLEEFLTKEDLGDIQKSINEILEKFSKFDELDDLKVAVKAKDDQISALTKRLEIVEKSEEKPKIKSDTKVKSKKHDMDLIQDPLRAGTYYKDLY